jgi:Flp pilus assembly protein TadG
MKLSRQGKCPPCVADIGRQSRTARPAHAKNARANRSGVAVAELAIILPFLAFMFVITIDYSRIFYYSLTVENCARNAALYACDPTDAALESPYTSVTQAGMADAPNLSPAPTITTSTSASGKWVTATANYTFSSLTQFPFVPSTVTISRSVTMRIVVATPSFSTSGSSGNQDNQ